MLFIEFSGRLHDNLLPPLDNNCCEHTGMEYSSVAVFVLWNDTTWLGCTPQKRSFLGFCASITWICTRESHLSRAPIQPHDLSISNSEHDTGDDDAIKKFLSSLAALFCWQ